ncbi:cytochrome P450 [Nocardia wallacei]|uniref:cytochrome P450 n=1 Tax=Nocardia wallacei TaxID=480035 RepID=UPI0024583807|nr:cytochrome P450 [Nocardia wallacei]
MRSRREPSADWMASDGMPAVVRGWLAASADAVPVSGDSGIVIKHPNEIRRVLASGVYASETPVHRHVLGSVGQGGLTTSPAGRLGERLLMYAATRDYQRLDRVTTEHVDALVERLDRRAADGEEVDLTEEMSRLTLSVIAELALGWNAADELAEALAAARFDLDNADGRAVGLVRERVEQTPIARGSVLTAMLAAGRSRDEIAARTATMLLGAHHVSANCLVWPWISLIRTPPVYRWWQQQLRAAPALARALTSDVTKESLRLFPPHWLMGRTAAVDIVVGGHMVPAGTTIVISPFVTHRHPAFWREPEAFDPQRPRPRHRYAWMPFGLGARTFLGSSFTLWISDIILSVLGRRLRFHSDTALRAVPHFGDTLVAPPLPVTIESLGVRR